MLDRRNYRWGGMVYWNPEDPRLVVPKTWRGMGWTMNFARPDALRTLALLCLVVPLPALLTLGLTLALGWGGSPGGLAASTVAVGLSQVVMIAALCSWSAQKAKLPPELAHRADWP